MPETLAVSPTRTAREKPAAFSHVVSDETSSRVVGQIVCFTAPPRGEGAGGGADDDDDDDDDVPPSPPAATRGRSRAVNAGGTDSRWSLRSPDAVRNGARRYSSPQSPGIGASPASALSISARIRGPHGGGGRSFSESS